MQRLTAGKSIFHAEMFPLLHTDRPNPLELFQIWLNLAADSKMVESHFTMFWSQDIPRRTFAYNAGRSTEVVVIAGALPAPVDAGGSAIRPLALPPDSWASRLHSDLAMGTLRLEPGAQWTLPAALGGGTRRKLYFFAGSRISIDAVPVNVGHCVEVRSGVDVVLSNGDAPAELLMLQVRPIGEPVAQYGPFVMNNEQELHRPSRTTVAPSSAAGRGRTRHPSTATWRTDSRDMRTARRSGRNPKLNWRTVLIAAGDLQSPFGGSRDP